MRAKKQKIKPASADVLPIMPLAEAAEFIDLIADLAAKSDFAKHKWKPDNSKAPLAYVKGMACVFARVYCKLQIGDVAAVEMAKAKSDDPDTDALAFYDDHFTAAGMMNDTSGDSTLRHLFVLLVGLGIRESSGRHCVGKYKKQHFDRADNAEAGLFQSSYNLVESCKKILTDLIAHYSSVSATGFLEIFEAGVTCEPDDWKNWGDPNHPGFAFQQLSKVSPAFAAEFAAVALRHDRKNWGPINNEYVELTPKADALFKDIESLMDASPAARGQLL